MLIYEIYISSFNDTNNDGLGDINGIREKLNYLKEINVDAIWVTPFYPSPKVDNGYDVANYREVDPLYGTLSEFKAMIQEAHALGLKVFIDVVFNHSSDKHEWFEKSIRKEEGFDDYYFWFDEIQNDWESFFGGKAWSYNETRNQYYLHRFAKEQPDLNLANPKVQEELIDVLKYWVDLGIDGFRFDVINFVITDKDRIFTQTSKDTDVRIEDPGAKAFITKMKQSLPDNITFIGEVGSEEIEILESYVGNDLMDMVFNFNIGSIKTLDLKELYKQLKVSTNPTMLFSSHDMMRMHTRLSKNNKNISYLLFELLVNYADNFIVYQGDEQLIDDFIPKNIMQVKDFNGINRYNELVNEGVAPDEAFEEIKEHTRDYSRTLMDWQGHVEEKFLKITNEKRDNEILQKGKITNIELIDEVLCFTKTYMNKSFHIVLNFSEEATEIKYEDKQYLLDPYGVFKGEK